MSDGFGAQQEMSQSVKQLVNPQSLYYNWQFFSGLLKSIREMRKRTHEAKLEVLNQEKSAIADTGMPALEKESPGVTKQLQLDREELNKLQDIRAKNPDLLTDADKKRIPELKDKIAGVESKALDKLKLDPVANKESLDKLATIGEKITKRVGKLDKLNKAGIPGIFKILDKFIKLLIKFTPLRFLIQPLIPKRHRYPMLANIALTQKGREKYTELGNKAKDEWFNKKEAKRQNDKGKEVTGEEAKKINEGSREKKERNAGKGQKREKTLKEAIPKAKKQKEVKETKEKAKAVSKSPKQRKMTPKAKNEARAAIKKQQKLFKASGVKMSSFKSMMLRNSMVKQIGTAQKLLTLNKHSKVAKNIVKQVNQTAMKAGIGVKFEVKGKNIITQVVGKKK